MKVQSISKPKFLFLNLKSHILPIVFLLFIIFLLLYSSQNLLAAKSGLLLWANSIIPSLFPFFVATELLGYTNIIYYFQKVLTPIMRPLFNVPGSGAFALVMGVISGYPTGAIIVTNFRKSNLCSIEECERLLAFTNNSGPLFIIGSVGISMFFNSTIGLILFVTHFLASISVGIIFRFWKYKNTKKSFSLEKNNKYTVLNKNSNVYLSNLGEVLSKSITSATKTIIMIGGFVVLFSVILSIMQSSNLLKLFSSCFIPFFKVFGIEQNSLVLGFTSGIIELTNGLSQISTIPNKKISLNIIVSAFLLGFGGISILLQVWAIVSKTDISIKPYIIGKILQGIIAATYTYIFIKYIPIFNLNL